LDQKWLAMAFGMPEANLSSRPHFPQRPENNCKLDTVVFGMPKILPDLFC
jgi:hypothetical protein